MKFCVVNLPAVGVGYTDSQKKKIKWINKSIKRKKRKKEEGGILSMPGPGVVGGTIVRSRYV